MIPVSAPAESSRVNVQTPPLPLSTRDVAPKTLKQIRRGPVQCTFSDGVRNVESRNGICGDANLVGVIVVKKAVHLHWLLATSSTSWRNRESSDAHAHWRGYR